jgi:hypothetical protein
MQALLERTEASNQGHPYYAAGKCVIKVLNCQEKLLYVQVSVSNSI